MRSSGTGSRIIARLMALAGCAAVAAAGPVYRFPEAELLSADFTTEPWGSGSLSSRQDLAGPGVQYTLLLGTAADQGKTVIGDSWAVAAAAGLAWDGGYLPGDPAAPHAQPHDNVDISAWSRIAMRVTVMTRFAEVRMKLFMNTGLTGPSAYPSNDARNNTFWSAALTTIKGGESRLLVLDFDRAQVYDAADNPSPHSGAGEGWTNGTWHAINERDRREITNIGFEAYGSAGTTVTLDLELPATPPSLALAGNGSAGPLALQLTAADARDYRIESSADLLRWDGLTLLPCVTGAVAFTDALLPDRTRRYYRAVSVP